ncbi:redoxin domain-containing protein [Bacteroidia bacterium]|nr:redoxin domain-containing protein [Bacteroidia bacterium]
MKIYKYILIIFGFFISCNSTSQSSSFKNIIQKSDYSVFMFLAPDCPLCRTISTPFSELSKEYPTIQFMGIISGKYYTPMEINQFATETKFAGRLFRDYDYLVAHQLNATVTPEFYVLNKKGDILYQGMMDDRMEELGIYKQQWKNHYLMDVLDALVNNKPFKIKKTKAIGCSLEY